jgi:cytochrome c biogenesis protein CcmG/thiol:disulfide interchange protein DsbE
MQSSSMPAPKTNTRRLVVALVPLGLFIALVALLVFGLGNDPRKVPSPLVGKPAPQFSLPELTDPGRSVSTADLMGKISLVNVWASWCGSCRAEHQALMALSDNPDFQIVGLNWKDEAANATQVLRLTGNPYDMNGYDPDNTAGIDWGVYGAPETFVVDQQGIIRYKHIGPIDRGVWEQTLKPLVARLKADG